MAQSCAIVALQSVILAGEVAETGHLFITGGDVANAAEMFAKHCATFHDSGGQVGLGAWNPISILEYLA